MTLHHRLRFDKLPQSQRHRRKINKIAFMMKSLVFGLMLFTFMKTGSGKFNRLCFPHLYRMYAMHIFGSFICGFVWISFFFWVLFGIPASTIHRQSREIDNERLTATTTRHSPTNISSNKNDSVNNSFHNILSNESSGHISNNGYNHDDAKFIISSDAHSLPIVAPAEPKSKSKYISFRLSVCTRMRTFQFALDILKCIWCKMAYQMQSSSSGNFQTNS